MLVLAKVKRNDVLYDLGSGDGRIVVTAAKQYGARGIGYDLDPKRIAEANENARAAGVQDRVKFIKQDLFEANLGEATVVTLYLLPEVNLKLRPKLLKELRPGTRIVSHNYGLGDWDPITTERLETAKGHHLIFFWVVPEKGTKPNL
jgi:predicted RNA methylase